MKQVPYGARLGGGQAVGSVSCGFVGGVSDCPKAACSGFE